MRAPCFLMALFAAAAIAASPASANHPDPPPEADPAMAAALGAAELACAAADLAWSTGNLPPGSDPAGKGYETPPRHLGADGCASAWQNVAAPAYDQGGDTVCRAYSGNQVCVAVLDHGCHFWFSFRGGGCFV